MSLPINAMLTPQEIEVEVLVRGINRNSDDHVDILKKMMDSELKRLRNKPKMSHATQPEIEIGACREMVEQLKGLCDIITTESEFKDRQLGLAKAIHWYDRANRARNSFGDVMNVVQISNKLRRCVKHFEATLISSEVSENHSAIISESGGDESGDDLDKTITENNDYLGGNSADVNGEKSNPKNPVSISESNRRTTTSSAIPKTNGGVNAIYTTASPPSFSRFNLSTNNRVSNNFNDHRQQFVNSQSLCSGQLQYPGSSSANFYGPPMNNRPQSFNNNHYQSFPSYRAPSPSLPCPSYQPVYLPNPADSNRSLPYSFKKPPSWKIMFDGTTSNASLDVHDFVFRLETYAEQDGFPVERLSTIVHNFVGGAAEKWVWTYKRGHPNSSWTMVKGALLNRFSSQESDRATRRMLERRLQKPRESFNDFVLELEATNYRLVVPFEEAELLEIIRENMNPALQNVTVAHNIRSIEALRCLCLKFETLWANGVRSTSAGESYQRRVSAFQGIDEFSSTAENKNVRENRSFDCKFYRSQGGCNFGRDTEYPSEINLEPSSAINLIQPSVAAASQPNHAMHPDPSMKLICWNCRDIGHRYQDCHMTLLHIFCFGCGLAGYIKPQCPTCASRSLGKAKPSAFNSREMHSGNTVNPEKMTKETVATNTEPAKYR